MTDSNKSEIVFIIDKSGSMSGLESDTIGGINSVIDRQKESDSDCIVSTVFFNHELETMHDRIPLASVPKMTGKDYIPTGSTALYDAIGHTIKHIQSVQYALKEGMPGKTMMVIITDGYENSSKEYRQSTVKKIIEEKTEQGWEFVFMGANIDVARESAKIGIREDCSFEYETNVEGMECCYDMVCESISKWKDE